MSSTSQQVPQGAASGVTAAASTVPSTITPTDKIEVVTTSPTSSTTPPKCAVILCCGSFSPITYMHLLLMESAKARVEREGYHVVCGYLSPVNDTYSKPGLAPASSRIMMCRLAVEDSSWIMISGWESMTGGGRATWEVVEHVQAVVDHALKMERSGEGNVEGVQVVLACGVDLVRAMGSGGNWPVGNVARLFSSCMLAVLQRPGDDDKEGAFLVKKEDTWLSEMMTGRVLQIDDDIICNISSSMLRSYVRQGRSIAYLTAPAVVRYIKEHDLYKNDPEEDINGSRQPGFQHGDFDIGPMSGPIPSEPIMEDVEIPGKASPKYRRKAFFNTPHGKIERRTGMHFAERQQLKCARHCMACSKTTTVVCPEGRRKVERNGGRTRDKCPKCNVFLCTKIREGNEKTCFDIWHEKDEV